MSEKAPSLNRTSRSSVSCWEILCGIVQGRTGDKDGGPCGLSKSTGYHGKITKEGQNQANQICIYTNQPTHGSESITSPCGCLKELGPWGNSAIRLSKLSCCMKLMSTRLHSKCKWLQDVGDIPL